jgi:hypothetical protein
MAVVILKYDVLRAVGEERRMTLNASGRKVTERRKQLIIRNVVPPSEIENQTEVRATFFKSARICSLYPFERAKWTDYKLWCC